LKLSSTSIGIIFAILAYFSFSLLDTIQKTAVVYHSIFQILFLKYIFTLFLSVAESYRKKNNNFFISKNFKLQITRSILSIIESGCFVLSFKYLTLADAHSIASLTPVIVVALSAIILRENVNLKTWIAIFFGFLGVLIIMRPGLSIFDPKSLIPLVAAFFLSLYQIVTRKVSENDSSETSLFYTSILGIILMSFMLPFFWQPMQSFSYFIFLGVGFFFSVGIYFQIIALGYAKASVVQPFHYTLVLWAIILGYIFYNDLPDIPTLIGATVITISGIYVLNSRTRSN
jgi:drug/metabolite transporter (DMT)-like permease|tara:strand:- start:5581 stop:6441 length:861 start_codon:yes stop_codon:yes gene_type:complete